MSTFSKATFNAAAYAASRPAYPPALYAHILRNFGPRPGSASPTTLLDLGCGPGLSTFEFVGGFERVVGLDPGAGMVKAARGILEGKRKDRFGEGREGREVRFEQGKGEELVGLVGEGEVDLVVAGQAAHWFDAPKVYEELARALKPGGAFAFFGYGECFLPNHPKTSALITPYSSQTLGPYWQQPGRSIVEALLTPFPFPSHPAFDPSSFHRHFLTVDAGPSPSARPAPPGSPAFTSSYAPLMLRQQWDLGQFEAYLRTWSAALSYDEVNGGDVVGEMMGMVRGVGEWEEGEKVEVAWEMAVMSGRKRE